MTESVVTQEPSAVRAAMEAELLAVDAIARFKFDDGFQIHHFGETIDNIPNLSPEDTAAFRRIANLLNEPDTESQALDEPLSLNFPASQERLAELRRSTQFEEYLQFSQSQSTGGSQSSPLPPAPNQQANQQQLLKPVVVPSQKLQVPQGTRSTSREASPVRKSSRPAAPKIMSGYVMGDGDQDLPPAAAMSGRLRQSPSSTSGVRPRSTSPSPADAPPKKKGKGRANPIVARGAAGTAEERKLLAQAKVLPTSPAEKRRPLSNPPRPNDSMVTRSAVRDQSQEPPLLASPALQRSVASSARLELSSSPNSEDEDEEEGPSILAIMKAQRLKASSSSRDVPQVPTTTTNALTLSKGEGSESQAAREAKLGAPMFEDGLPLSRAAKASLFGWTLSEGYEGFKYLSTFKKGNKIKESWLCLKCGDPKTASMQGKPTNLKTHLGSCSGPKNEHAVARLKEAGEGAEKRSGMAASSTLPGGSYRGASVRGWLNAHQGVNIDLTRQLALVCVVRNALPFTLLSSTSMKQMIRSLDHRATISFKSARTVQRDLKKFHAHLASNLLKEVRGIDTLMALQHDGWTNKGFQHSFMGIIGSYVDAKWQYHERLLSFDVVQQQHSDATFAGHLVRTIKKLNLDDKWYGAVTSDSAGTNTRMLTLMENDLAQEKMQRRDHQAHQNDPSVHQMMKNSHSAFPKASLCNSGSWTPADYKVLCLCHHINLAVRDGFAKFGIKTKTKTQKKVLDIRPKPAITITDENGEEVPASDSDETDDEEDDEELVGDDAEEEGDDGDEDAPPLDEDVDDEDDEPGMAPNDEDIGSDDDGGPDANGEASSAITSISKPVNGVGKLAAFTTWIHRSSQRRAAFRRQMAKKYHRDPDLASAPFPSKPNQTRWNSHFAMIQSALKIRAAIDAHCRAHIGRRGEVLGDYLLTETQWRQLVLLEPILKLAAAVTKKMEKTEGTLYAVLDHHASLRDDIARHLRLTESDKELDDDTKKEIAKFLNAMEVKLRKYREMALRNRVVLAATLLHPNNRKLFKISYPAYRLRAETALRELLDELIDIKSPDSSPALQMSQLPATNADPPSPCSAARARREQAAEESAISQDDGSQEDEVARYLDPKTCPWRETDGTPYKWWRDNEAVFPTIAKLARIVLAIPGSSSAVERVFSQAALVSTNRRASLSAASISRLVTTRHWLLTGADELAGLSEQALKVAHSHERLPNPDDTKRKKSQPNKNAPKRIDRIRNRS